MARRGTGPVVYHPSNLAFEFPRQFRELAAISNQWRFQGDVQVGANGSLPVGIELERARETGVSWESQGVGVCPTVGTCRRDASAWSISNSTPCGDARAQSNSACSSDTAFFPSGTTSPPLIMSVVGGEATVRSRTRADGVDTVG